MTNKPELFDPVIPQLLAAKSVKQIMTSAPAWIDIDGNLQEAISLLASAGVRAVPVVQSSGEPVGVLSQTDIVEYYQDGSSTPPEKTAVKDLMTPVIYAVKEDASILDGVKIMLDKQLHRIFITDRENALVGVLSMQDILRHMLQEVV